MNLIAYLEVCEFTIQEKIFTVVRNPLFILISQHLLEILKEDTRRYELSMQTNDNQQYVLGTPPASSIKY